MHSGRDAAHVPAWADPEEWLDEVEAVRDARERAEELGCTPMGRGMAALLRLLAVTQGAQAVVEVGTGTGVSGAALLAALGESGTLTTIDVEAENQRVARETFVALGYDHVRTRLIAGRALQVLPRLADASYDMVVADADRAEYPAILHQAARLLRPGGLVAFASVLGYLRGNHSSVMAGRRGTGVLQDEAEAMEELVRTVHGDDRWLGAMIPVDDGLLVATWLGARSEDLS
jgi:predicted O-methyltransferase YrrM